jgi:hypothetical protein
MIKTLMEVQVRVKKNTKILIEFVRSTSELQRTQLTVSTLDFLFLKH